MQYNVPIKSQRADLLRAATIVTWDELVMNHKENFEAVDQMLRIVRGEPGLPCGNLLVIAAGDFRQIPPVVVDGGKWETINASIKSSKLWPEFTKTKLADSIRQAKDQKYST